MDAEMTSDKSAEAFDRFIQKDGADILRFCRMKAGEYGDELYQDAMLKLLEKKNKLNYEKNPKSYALSVCIFIWKNAKRKYKNRLRIAPPVSIEDMANQGIDISETNAEYQPEESAVNKAMQHEVREKVEALPEKYSTPIYLYYSANMKLNEIAEILKVPVGTVKSRMRRAKDILKSELEEQENDGRKAESGFKRRIIAQNQ